MEAPHSEVRRTRLQRRFLGCKLDVTEMECVVAVAAAAREREREKEKQPTKITSSEKVSGDSLVTTSIDGQLASAPCVPDPPFLSFSYTRPHSPYFSYVCLTLLLPIG